MIGTKKENITIKSSPVINDVSFWEVELSTFTSTEDCVFRDAKEILYSIHGWDSLVMKVKDKEFNYTSDDSEWYRWTISCKAEAKDVDQLSILEEAEKYDLVFINREEYVW